MATKKLQIVPSETSTPVAPTVIKPARKAPPRKLPMPKGPLDIVSQVKTTFSRKHWIAAAFGTYLGIGVPIAIYHIAHSLTSWYDVRALLVLGGLLFSATTVYQWGRLAFGSWYKALGFVVLIEGTMTFTHGWLSMGALCYLIVINVVGTSTTIALRVPKLTETVAS